MSWRPSPWPLWSSAALIAGCVGHVGQGESEPPPSFSIGGGDGAASPPGSADARQSGADGLVPRAEPPAVPPPRCAPSTAQTTDIGLYLDRLATCHFKARAAR